MHLFAIFEFNASPTKIAISTAPLFKTGNTPGIPKVMGEVSVLGSCPNSAPSGAKILDFVFSWAWTSRPITTSYLSLKDALVILNFPFITCFL